MRQLTIDETKTKELDILKSVRDFCDAHQLRYYLCGGTLIGAVRHKGFIPWDDDIDIIMPRPDYMEFIKLFPEEGVNGYKLMSPYNDKECFITFSKVYDTTTLKKDREVSSKYWKCGIDIDVFPTDGVPNESEIDSFFRKQYRDFHIFLALVGGFEFKGSVPKKIVKAIVTALIKIAGSVGIFNANKMALKINNRAMKYSVNEANKIAVSIFPHYGKREIVSKEAFLKQIILPFEDDMFTAPSSYDEYLSSLYGDYIKLPPKEKKSTSHLSDFWTVEDM